MPPLHFETGERWLRDNLQALAKVQLPPLTFLNINIPAIAYPEIQGHKIVGMGQRVYEDRVEPRQDPWGRTYYWQGGVQIMRPDIPDTDVWAVSQGFVSITPVTLDWTNYEAVESLRDLPLSTT